MVPETTHPLKPRRRNIRVGFNSYAQSLLQRVMENI